MKEKLKYKSINNKNGITLIALVITIIVLLILASVSIAMLTGNNGILSNAEKSEEETKISEEKEKVKMSQSADLISNDGKNNTKQGIQQELDKIEGINKTKVFKDGKDSYIVTFLDTNRNYKIGYGKDVEGPVEIEIVEDSQAGDITKGNTLDGSKEKPYQINCIEDLVDFSNNSKTDKFNGKEIIMTRNLDFQSELSYEDYQTNKYGDINNDGTTSELMEELTTGTGFKPINIFQGTFDGKNNKLNNLYINSTETDAGLFREIYNSTIKNLKVNGEVNARSVMGGITAKASGKVLLYNLEYSGKIGEYNGTVKHSIGGIVGWTANSESEIEINKSKNQADIVDSAYIGGIVGRNDGKIKITNCYNKGNLINKLYKGAIQENYITVGGIIAATINSNVNIENCYNIGTIINEVNSAYCASGGILGSTSNCKDINITNCYNIGKTSAKYSYIAPFSGGIQGGFWYGQYRSNINNCYYDSSKSDRSVGGAKEEYATKLTTEQMQGKEKINNQDGTSNTLVELLNKEIDNNTNGIDTTEWLRWKQGEDGYPTFE